MILPNGSRAGFFIGDGAGVGKGRQVRQLFQTKIFLRWNLLRCSKKGDANSLSHLQKISVEVAFNESCSAEFATFEVFGY